MNDTPEYVVSMSKFERSLPPKDNIKPNSEFVILIPITINRNYNGRLKRGMSGLLTRHNPPQYKLNQKKISYAFSLLYRVLIKYCVFP